MLGKVKMGFKKQHKNPLVFGTENSDSDLSSDIVQDKNCKFEEDYDCFDDDIPEELTSRQNLPFLDI